MKIAACLITKNSEQTIGRCLDSLRPHVDGIFVYDTGSTDGTVELLELLAEQRTLVVDEHGNEIGETTDKTTRGEPREGGPQFHELPLASITVERGEWRDDFAWAREQSFAMPDDSYDFLLWADDDDVVEGAGNLRQLAATMPAGADGYLAVYDYARDEHGNCVCVLWRERLLRRAAGYTWRERVHEVLVPSEERPANLAVLPPNVLLYVHHRPAERDTEGRNLRLLELQAEDEKAERGNVKPRTLAYLGTETMATGDWQTGARHLDAYLQHPEARWSDERMQVRHKLATCLRALGRPHDAVECELQGLHERHDWCETWVGLMEAYSALGDWARAEFYGKIALDVKMPQSSLILNPLEFTFLPYLRLSIACANTGRHEEAQAWMGKAAELAPSNPMLAELGPQLEKARFEGTLVSHVLGLREMLVRFDENEKALRLLEDAVPYAIADRPEIVAARVAQRENCRHLLEPDEYERWYSEEPKESTVTDEFVPRAAEVYHRVAFLEQGLAEQEAALGRKPDVLDLGCNDFWVGAYLQTKGYHVDGVELNRRSYELALERAQRFANGGPGPLIVHGDLHDAPKLLDGRRYDAVSLFEVLEHVPDVQATLAACERLLRPGGRVYVSTPDGAYELGALDSWHVVERKGHLRAIPSHQLADMISPRGEITGLDFGQRLTVASWTPKRKRGKVIFQGGGCVEHWHPQQALDRGLGGSETALVQVAMRLGLSGYEVKVYADVDPAISAGGVLWRPHTAWDPTEDCDAMIVSRMPAAFAAPIRAPVRALWCHDHSYPDMSPELAERMTHVVVLSDWERERFGRLYPYLADKLVVIRNGITLDYWDGSPRFPGADSGFHERKPRCIYSSSADRGLDVLLELWPEIRKRARDAELHVAYGWDVYDRVAFGNPTMLAYKERVYELAEQAGGEDGGVFMRGRIGQRDLYEEMTQARVWAYPTAFLETSCIGAMEARAAGLAVVTSNLGALAETVGRHGVRLPWAEDEAHAENQEVGYREAFIRHVSQLLADERVWTEWHEKALAGIGGYSWDRRTALWEALVREGVDARRESRKPRRRGRARAAVAV